MTTKTVSPVVPEVTVEDANAIRVALVVASYVAAKPAARRTLLATIHADMRTNLDAMQVAMTDGKMPTAMALMAKGQVLADMVAACNATDGPAEKVAAAPIDPRTVIAQRVANLRLAADLLEQGYVSPDGLEGSPEISVESFGLTLPYAAGDYAAAVHLASAKITRSTVQTPIADVCVAAFKDLAVGAYLTSTQIGVQGGHPKAGKASGAISAHLYGGTAVLVGYRAATDADGKGAGAFKI